MKEIIQIVATQMEIVKLKLMGKAIRYFLMLGFASSIAPDHFMFDLERFENESICENVLISTYLLLVVYHLCSRATFDMDTNHCEL